MPNLTRFQAVNTVMRDYQKRWIRLTRLFRRQPIRLQIVLIFLVGIIPLVLLLRYIAAATLFAENGSINASNASHKGHRHAPFEGSSILENAASLKRIAKIESEAALRRRYVCKQQPLENNVHLLKLCGESRASTTDEKIVALVEVRNVEHSIYPFLAALSKTVDTVVILDDHSSDLSRNAILLFNTRFAFEMRKPSALIVEALLNKTGEWIREELFDRQILLKVGRQVGGTHFVFLDYDEYFSANCVNDGLLRRNILSLQPGHSLYLPWIEVWKTPRVQAVLTADRETNFLKRRQIVVFADDAKSQFTAHNSVAKIIPSRAEQRDGSIHVLRCPRTICDQPPRYAGAPLSRSWGRVRVLAQCKIIEMRFLNLNNVLLKLAWYEALGRVMGAKDGVTAGKMVDMIVTRFKQADRPAGSDVDVDDAFALASTNPEWFDGFDERIFDAHGRVEMWRGEEIIEWVNKHGRAYFVNLEVMPMININELKTTVAELVERDDIVHHVPRHKTGMLIIAIDSPKARTLSEFLRNSSCAEVKMDLIERGFERGSNAWEDQVNIEEWRKLVISSISQALAQGSDGDSRRAFLSRSGSDTLLSLALLEVARNELGHVNVLVVFGDRVDGTMRSGIFDRALKFAQEMGSHVSLLDVPFASFGSAMTLRWLHERLRMRHTMDAGRVVTFAEETHKQYGEVAPLGPVARAVFSLNVGRCGSKYLADVLATVGGPMAAVHEADCPGRECTKGGGMHMQTRSLNSSYEWRRAVKLPLVRKAVGEAMAAVRADGRRRWTQSRTCDCWEIARGEGGADSNMYKMEDDDSGNGWEMREIFEASYHNGCAIHTVMDVTYAETNPNFKAWFYDVVLDELPQAGYDVGVIVVRKYVAAVLKSLFETGFFSSRDGYTWMETAAGVNAKVDVEALKNDNELNGVEKLLSYIINAEGVFQHVIQTYGGNASLGKRAEIGGGKRRVRFVQVRAEEMYGVHGIDTLLRRVGLGISEETARVAGQVRDKYGNGGRKRIGHISLVECEERVRKIIRRCDGDGVGGGARQGAVASLLSNWSRVDGFEYEHK